MAAVSGPHAADDASSLLRLYELRPQNGWENTGECPVEALRNLALLAAREALRLVDIDAPLPTTEELCAVRDSLETQLECVTRAIAYVAEGTQETGTAFRLLASPEPRNMRTSSPGAAESGAEGTGDDDLASAEMRRTVGRPDRWNQELGLGGVTHAQLADFLAPPLLDALVDRFREPVLGNLEETIVDRLVARLTPELVFPLSCALEKPLLASLGPQLLDKVLIPNKLVAQLERTLLPRLVNEFYQPVVDAIGDKYSWSEERVARTGVELPGTPMEIARQRRVSAAGFLGHGGEGGSGFGAKRERGGTSDARESKRSRNGV